MSNPNPDPGEEYPHANTQLFNIVDPAGNEFQRASYEKSQQSGYMKKPWNNPAPDQTPTMDGFVHDYCSNFVSINTQVPLEKSRPTFDQYRVIMDCFGPESLPVINTLSGGPDVAVGPFLQSDLTIAAVFGSPALLTGRFLDLAIIELLPVGVSVQS